VSDSCCGPGNDDESPRAHRIGLIAVIAIVVVNGLVAAALIFALY